jgi:hypothetical protein
MGKIEKRDHNFRRTNRTLGDWRAGSYLTPRVMLSGFQELQQVYIS